MWFDNVNCYAVLYFPHPPHDEATRETIATMLSSIAVEFLKGEHKDTHYLVLEKPLNVPTD